MAMLTGPGLGQMQGLLSSDGYGNWSWSRSAAGFTVLRWLCELVLVWVSCRVYYLQMAMLTGPGLGQLQGLLSSDGYVNWSWSRPNAGFTILRWLFYHWLPFIVLCQGHSLSDTWPDTVYARYIAVGGVQAMVLRYKWERDILGDCHEPKSRPSFLVRCEW